MAACRKVLLGVVIFGVVFVVYSIRRASAVFANVVCFFEHLKPDLFHDIVLRILKNSALPMNITFARITEGFV